MNSSVFNKKGFWIGGFLLSVCFIFAQENDLYKRLIKESVTINKDFLLDPIHRDLFINDSISGYIELNVNKKPIPLLGFNYKQNSLYLHYKDSLPLKKQETISPYATANYTNQERFSPSSTETTGDIIANGFLTPLLGILKPEVLVYYLMRIGVLSDEPFVSKESKKKKALREIKNVYGIED
ncbi:MAG: hypothetical protein LBP83_00380 [Dysgonamonadaceae bacterium]|jgi:hypothetical protein|nr:hypothetical protein [Dysgonamonadaceae bacterium]